MKVEFLLGYCKPEGDVTFLLSLRHTFLFKILIDVFLTFKYGNGYTPPPLPQNFLLLSYYYCKDNWIALSFPQSSNYQQYGTNRESIHSNVI